MAKKQTTAVAADETPDTVEQPKPAHTLTPTPTVGRIVHFGKDDEPPLAALVTGVNEDGTLSLAVFTPQGGRFGKSNVHYRDENSAGWYWPARV